MFRVLKYIDIIYSKEMYNILIFKCYWFQQCTNKLCSYEVLFSYDGILMGIIKMSMQPTLWCGRWASLRCFAWDVGELVGSSLWPVWQYAHGSPETMNKRWKKLLRLWKTLPLFIESTQGPQWHYQLPWTLSWIPVNHGRMQQQTPTPFTKSYLWF